MKKLALVLAVVVLTIGCATTGIEGRAHAPLASPSPQAAGVVSYDTGANGAAIQMVRERTDIAVARAMAPDLVGMAVEPGARAGNVSREPEKANLTLKDKIAPLLKKGLPDGRDENTFTGGVSAGTSSQKASNPKVKGDHENITDRMKKAMLTVQLLLRRGKGGEANEGFSNASIQRVKKAVDTATADQGKGRPNAQESLQQGIMKVQLLMKRGKGCVADDGFNGSSVRSVDKAMSGPKGDSGHQESIQEKVFQYTRRSVGQGCGNSKCRE